MKGNDGKARRKQLSKRVGAVIGCCLGVIGLVEFFGYGRARTHRKRKGLRSLNPALYKQRREEHDASLLLPVEDEVTTGKKGLTKDEQIDLVLSASVHLIGISPKGSRSMELREGSYQAIVGEFCQLNWRAHKDSPSETPMFRDLVGKSSDCQNNAFHLDLGDIAARARKHDAAIRDDATLNEGGQIDGIDASQLQVPRPMKLRGVVFHESRCGSTLVANSLAAFDPERNRVYSESAPPISALRLCGDDFEKCSKKTAAAMLRDTIYMMSRTDNPLEDNLFFKIQSIGTRSIDVFAEAFPKTPFIFVYREPVHVMMSHLGKMNGKKMRDANCVRQRANPPKIVVDLAESKGKTVSALSHEEYCAAHLASLCDSALSEMKRSQTNMGQPVNYESLPDKLYDVIPQHFGVPLGPTDRDRIAQISGQYSKGRGTKAREWKDDSKRKEAMATPAIKDACKLFLDDTYRELEGRAIEYAEPNNFADEA